MCCVCIEQATDAYVEINPMQSHAILFHLIIITVRNSICRMVMFLHLSVILFTGESVYPSMNWAGSVSVQGVSARGCVCPGECLPRGCLPGVSAHGVCLPRGGVCLGGRVVSAQAGICPVTVSAQGATGANSPLEMASAEDGMPYCCKGAFPCPPNWC